MHTELRADTGVLLDARIDIEDGAIILHSRGGAFGKPNLRNPGYRKALVVIVSRLLDSKFGPMAALG